MTSPRTRSEFTWCREPACQSDLDSAAYPRLLPRRPREHAEQIALPFAVFRGSVTRRTLMDILYACCAGLDVHKETVVATIRCRLDNGKVRQLTRTYGTMTEQLLELGDWLQAEGVTHLAMESTGVYWKPIWNLLEERFQIVLGNAQHIKHVPGRKTDVKDSTWIAQLMQC